LKAPIQENLTDKAYAQIKEMILSGQVKPGDLISISHMAETLQISRTPITAACQKLEYEKFLTVMPKQGVIINTISLETAREIYELRAAIESYNAKRALDHITAADMDLLAASIEKQCSHIASGDHLAFMKEDTFFHRYILKKYSNYAFLSTVDTLYDRAFLLGMRNTSPARLQETIAEHRKILAALQSGNKQAFADAIEENILNGYRNLTNNL